MSRHISKHALARMQQRGIAMDDLDLLDEFGNEHYDGHGGVILSFNRTNRRRARQILGKPVRSIYLVESASDGTVITVGHRVSRIRRK